MSNSGRKLHRRTNAQAVKEEIDSLKRTIRGLEEELRIEQFKSKETMAVAFPFISLLLDAKVEIPMLYDQCVAEYMESLIRDGRSHQSPLEFNQSAVSGRYTPGALAWAAKQTQRKVSGG